MNFFATNYESLSDKYILSTNLGYLEQLEDILVRDGLPSIKIKMLAFVILLVN